MIKINQKFSIYRDKYSWNLVETGALKVNAKTRKESRPTKIKLLRKEHRRFNLTKGFISHSELNR